MSVSLDDSDVGIKDHEAVLGLFQETAARKTRSSSSLEITDMPVSSPPPGMVELGDAAEVSLEAMEDIWNGQDSSNDSRSSMSDTSDRSAADHHQWPTSTNGAAKDEFTALPPLPNIVSRGPLQGSTTFNNSDIRRELWGYSHTSDDPLLQAYNLQQTARELHDTISDQIAPASSQLMSTPRATPGVSILRSLADTSIPATSPPSLTRRSSIRSNAINNGPEEQYILLSSQPAPEVTKNNDDCDDSDEDLNEIETRLFEHFDFGGVSKREFKVWLKHAPADELDAARSEIQNEDLLVSADKESKQPAGLKPPGVMSNGKVGTGVDEPASLQLRHENPLPQKDLGNRDSSSSVLPSRELMATNNVQNLPQNLFLSLMRSQVEFYAKNHEFFKSSHVPHTTTERRDFTRDVYDYARARGMSSTQSQVEVKRIGKAYRKNRRIAKVLQWIDIANEQGRGMEDELQRIRDEEGWNTDEIEGNFPDDQSDAGTNLGTEIDDSAELLKEAARMVQSKISDSRATFLPHESLSKAQEEARERRSVEPVSAVKRKRSRLDLKASDKALDVDEQHSNTLRVERERFSEKYFVDLSAKEVSKESKGARKKKKREEAKNLTRNNEVLDGSANAGAAGRTESESKGKLKPNRKDAMVEGSGQKPSYPSTAMIPTPSHGETSQMGGKRKQLNEGDDDKTDLERPKKRARNRKRKKHAEKVAENQNGHFVDEVETSEGTIRRLLYSEEDSGEPGTPITIGNGDVPGRTATLSHVKAVQTDPKSAKKERKRLREQRRREKKALQPQNSTIPGDLSSKLPPLVTTEEIRAKAASYIDDAHAGDSKKSKSKRRAGRTTELANGDQGPPSPTLIKESESAIYALKSRDKEKDMAQTNIAHIKNEVSKSKDTNAPEEPLLEGSLTKHVIKAVKRKHKRSKAAEIDNNEETSLETALESLPNGKRNVALPQKGSEAEKEAAPFKEKKKKRIKIEQGDTITLDQGGSSLKPPTSLDELNQENEIETVSVRKSRKSKGDRVTPKGHKRSAEKSGFREERQPGGEGTAREMQDVEVVIYTSFRETVEERARTEFEWGPNSGMGAVSDGSDRRSRRARSMGNIERTLTTPPKAKRRTSLRSPYFKELATIAASTSVTRTGKAVSVIPFPCLSSPRFGLIQEKFAHDPFKLLVAVTFLNKTKGIHAIPVFYELMEKYPTPEDLAAADPDEVSKIIHHLGLQNLRARRYISLAKTWLSDPPLKGRRHRKLHYPNPGDGKDIKPREIIGDDDPRSGAWEIAHLPTTGRYALDSWRIFNRDELRGLAEDWEGTGAEEGFEPEWKRVAPMDKELRAYLRWKWLKEGWSWDPITGMKVRASEDLMERARWAISPGKDEDKEAVAASILSLLKK